jgi:hypothetical protein
MKRNNHVYLSKTATLALVLGALLTFGFSLTRATGFNPQNPQGGLLDIINRDKTALVGAWDAPDEDGFQTLLTFSSDGTLLASDEDPTTTNGHGVWSHLGGTQFAFTYIQHKKAGQPQQGTLTVWGTLILDAPRRSFTGPLHFEFTDATGTVLDSDTLRAVKLTLHGARIQLRQ